jgi:hypothetical protein
MARVATLSRVEIDIFLSSASPGQQAIVRALRDIITRRASGLTERVSTGKELIELKSYLIFEGPGGHMVFAIGLTAARTVTVHLMPYDGSRELQDRHGAALGPFLVGKSSVRFADPAELPADAIAAIVDATPGYLQGAAVTPARPKRWGRKRGAGG